MTAIILTLTDAGLAALTNHAHTGTAALTISHIGLSQQHAGAAAAQQVLTGLPGEFKRLETFGGEVLSPRTIHVFLRDESADAYSLRAFGLYASTGVLMAVVSSETPIMEKVPATTLLQAVDLTFARDIDAELVFGDTNFVNPPATMTRTGVVRLATAAEAESGERQDLAVTPWSLAKTLLSWAQNFAARLHGHSILDVNGLSDALAGKAAKNHQHSAADTTTGTFDPDRIPNIPQSKVQNLTQALAGKAPKAHEHDASETTTGVFHVDRIPKLSIGWINNLTETLADKAQALHSHTMAQVSGLIDTLAQKANLSGAQFLGNISVRAANNAGGLILQTGSNGQAGVLDFRGPDWTRWGYIGWGSEGDIEITADGSRKFRFNKRPSFAGATPWDNQNFDPADKANRVNPDVEGALTIAGSFAILQTLHRDAQDRISGLYASNGITKLWDNVHGDLAWFTPGGVSFPYEGNVYAAWHTGNFNPATKADASNWNNASSDSAVHGYKQFVGLGSSSISAGNSSGNRAALEVRAGSVGQDVGAAFLAFHRPGQFAALFGFDTDNQLKVGGWSYGETSFRVWTELNLKFASSGNTTNGAVAPGLNYEMLSPAALWSFAKSIGQNGYQQIPGTDLIIQWGVSNGSHAEGAVHAALPVAFGGGCLFACATPRNPSENHSMDFYMQVVSRHLDRIVFYANRANNSAGNMSGYEWMALGLAKGSPDPAYSSGGGYPPGGGGWEGGGPEIIP